MFPILLLSTHRLKDLIVNYFHIKFLNSGFQPSLHQIKQSFRIINGQSICKNIVHDCITSFREKQQVMDQLIADLSKERFKKMFSFNITTADF